MALLVGSAAVLAACDIDDGRQMQVPTTTTTTTAPPELAADPADSVGSAGNGPSEVPIMTLPGEQLDLGITAPWVDGGAIDAAFTCDGAGEPPAFDLRAPAEAAALAVTIVSDGGHVSVVVNGIPAGTEHLDLTALPAGAVFEVNSLGQRAYDPPCPDAGATGTYTATLHVLGRPVAVQPDDSVIEIFAAFEAAALATATVSGVYTGPAA